MEAQLKNDVKLSWGTPILIVKPASCDGVDSAFRETIQEKFEAANSADRFWQSSPDVLQWPLAEAEVVRSWFVEAFQRMLRRACEGQTYDGRLNIRCWASLICPGNLTSAVQFPHSAWTVLYRVGGVQASEEANVHLVLDDPRPGAIPSPDAFNLFGQARRLAFESGQVIVFPSWVRHRVDATSADQECIYLSAALATLDLM